MRWRAVASGVSPAELTLQPSDAGILIYFLSLHPSLRQPVFLADIGFGADWRLMTERAFPINQRDQDQGHFYCVQSTNPMPKMTGFPTLSLPVIMVDGETEWE